METGNKGLKTILVPTDFSQSSDIALQIAIDLAKQQGARIHLLHVVALRKGGGEKELMQRQLDRFADAKSVEVVPEVRKGRVSEEILRVQAEQDADLIVVARHKKMMHPFAVFRSVTEKIKRSARSSVLVVGA